MKERLKFIMQYKNLSYLHKVQEIPEITAVLSNT
jgi:hypothetical protein